MRQPTAVGVHTSLTPVDEPRNHPPSLELTQRIHTRVILDDLALLIGQDFDGQPIRVMLVPGVHEIVKLRECHHPDAAVDVIPRRG